MPYKTPRLIYIAGPMRGLPENNFSAFTEADRNLAAEGWEVINPASLSLEVGGEEQLSARPMLLEALIAAELSFLRYCDAIYLLPGWEESVGAREELATALTHKLQIVVDRSDDED